MVRSRHTFAEPLERRVLLCDTQPAGGASAQGSLPDGWSDTPKSVLVMLVRFADQQTPAVPAAAPDKQTTVARIETVRQFFAAQSFGKANFSSVVITDPISIGNAGTYGGDWSNVYAAARALAPGGPTAVDSYNLVAVHYNDGGAAGGRAGGFGPPAAGPATSGVWNTDSWVTFAHEFGHNFGLPHSDFWNRADHQTVLGPGSPENYGNIFDVMGVGATTGSHFNANAKWKMKWLPDANVSHVASSNTYTIQAFDPSDGVFDSTKKYAVHIHRPNEAWPGNDYWVGFRQHSALLAAYPSFGNGVEVGFGPDATSDSESLLLDTGWETAIKADSALMIGRTFSDPLGGLHITPLAKSAGAIDVRVNLFSGSNQAPTASLTPSGDGVTITSEGDAEVPVATPVTLTISGTDANQDSLAYYVDFGDGTSHFADNRFAGGHCLSRAPVGPSLGAVKATIASG